MELKLVDKDAMSIEIRIVDGRETDLFPIQEKLLTDDKVEIVTLQQKHRLLDKPVLYVRVKEGKPQTAVKRAAKALSNEVKDFAQLFDAARA